MYCIPAASFSYNAFAACALPVTVHPSPERTETETLRKAGKQEADCPSFPAFLPSLLTCLFRKKSTSAERLPLPQAYFAQAGQGVRIEHFTLQSTGQAGCG